MLGDAELPTPAPSRHLMGMPLPLPTYSIEDIRSWSYDGHRYELLDGMLLVTPGPSPAHQVFLSRLLVQVYKYLGEDPAFVVSPGDVEVRPKTLLEPDLLVFSSSYAIGTKWSRVRGWWLAVEVFSPGSRRYDRDYKRDAYLALGVREVWLVDLDEKCVLASRAAAPRDVRHDERLTWHPAEMLQPLTLDLTQLFRDIP